MRRRFMTSMLIGAVVSVSFGLGAVRADEPIPELSPAPSVSATPEPSASSSPEPSPTAPTPVPSSAPNPGRTPTPTPSGEGALRVRESPSGSGRGSSGRSARQGGQAGSVAIVDDAFRPAQLTVTVGTTVVWSHEGQNPHTVTADDRGFNSGTLESGRSFSVTFDQAGRVPYYCQIHGEPGSGMAGVVTVVQAAADEDPDQGSPTPGSNPIAETGFDVIPLGVWAVVLVLAGLIGLRLGGGERREEVMIRQSRRPGPTFGENEEEEG